MNESVIYLVPLLGIVGLVVMAIKSAWVGKQDAGDEKMKELAGKMKFDFPYLYDESQEVARAYDAACTPEFHIFDKDFKCVYRGQLDGARPSNDIPVTGRDVRRALDNMLAGKAVDPLQYPSIGCNIKWKAN